jgi:ribosomal protein S18 acetylase RimI-like enzyme
MAYVGGVVRLERSQAGRASEVLARAFHDDPFYAALLPDEAGRPRKLAWLMQRMLRYGLLYGHVYATPALEGVACWFPPRHVHPSAGDIVRSGLYALPVVLGWSACRRFVDFTRYAERMRARCVTTPHWYLMLLGVDHPYRGHGLGGRLLEPLLTKATHEKVACYLETENERNVGFYARYGFSLAEAGQEPRHGVRVWGLLRPAFNRACGC